ncbi:MAG: S-layer homology domain-containing protein [Candidatus Gastranaerophilaceae bacterium]|jgi:hypothetical protein
MKKNVTKLLAGLLFLSSTTLAVYAKDYPDVAKTHWAYPQINSLSNEYVLVGYPDGTFKPDEAATRAEFANMTIKALRQENSPLTKTFEFVDVPYSHWAYNTIQRAIAFDLIKNSPDGMFRPNDNVSKAEAIAIIVSALNTNNISLNAAKEALKKYTDISNIPSDILIPAGKSEILGMTAHAPESGNKFDAAKKATRAEIAVNLFNMIEQAKLNPNAKLAEAMKPKKGEGIVIEGVTLNGTIATIPAGAKIPVILLNNVSSNTGEKGEVFLSKTPKNLITKEKYLLVIQGNNINGEITAATHGRLLIRNGKLALDTKNINTNRGQCAPFVGNIDTKTSKSLWVRIMRYIFKGSKVQLKEGQAVYVQLEKPVRVDLTNGWILE